MPKLCGLCRLRHIRPRSRNHRQRRVRGRSRRPNSSTARTGGSAAAQPDWKPQTRLEHLSVELMNWFDDMMGA